ncbi:hypothetical protein OROHE_009704 [Orobanche hederae]
MVVPIVIRRVTSRGTVFSVLGIVKGLVADRICKGVARAWGIAQEKGHLINVIKGIRIELSFVSPLPLRAFDFGTVSQQNPNKEEAAKQESRKKSFNLILNYIPTQCGVLQSRDAKKIGTGKFIGGIKPTFYNKYSLLARRPFAKKMLQWPEKRHCQEMAENKLRKDSKMKATVAIMVTLDVLTVPSTVQIPLGAIPLEESVAAYNANPEPVVAMTDEQLFAKLDGSRKSAAHMEPKATSLDRVPTNVHDPSSNRATSPVQIEQVGSPLTTTNMTGKSGRGNNFVLEVTGTQNVEVLIHWEDHFCRVLITNYYLAKEKAQLKGKSQSSEKALSDSHNLTPTRTL